MAAESIGVLYSTKIPGYSDNADVQAAFKLYHYGSAEYNSANANTANLVNPSIAYTINSLQSQITTKAALEVASRDSSRATTTAPLAAAFTAILNTGPVNAIRSTQPA